MKSAYLQPLGDRAELLAPITLSERQSKVMAISNDCNDTLGSVYY